MDNVCTRAFGPGEEDDSVFVSSSMVAVLREATAFVLGGEGGTPWETTAFAAGSRGVATAFTPRGRG